MPTNQPKNLDPSTANIPSPLDQAKAQAEMDEHSTWPGFDSALDEAFTRAESRDSPSQSLADLAPQWEAAISQAEIREAQEQMAQHQADPEIKASLDDFARQFRSGEIQEITREEFIESLSGIDQAELDELQELFFDPTDA